MYVSTTAILNNTEPHISAPLRNSSELDNSAIVIVHANATRKNTMKGASIQADHFRNRTLATTTIATEKYRDSSLRFASLIRRLPNVYYYLSYGTRLTARRHPRSDRDRKSVV